MTEFYVMCPHCDLKKEDCKYPAKDYVVSGSDDTVKIRTGKETYICPECESEDTVDPDTNTCCVCETIVQPYVVVRCRECKKQCSALPSVERAPERKEGEDAPEWCELDAICEDMDFRVNLPCNHMCCLECFSMYAVDCCTTMNNVSYNDTRKVFSMNCFASCTIPHPIDLLRLGGEKNWEKLKEKMFEFRNNLDNNRCQCPLPNCGAVMINVPSISEKKVIRCLTCKRMFCRHCNEESKDGKCPSGEEMLDDDKTFRRCPQCHTPITHYYGDECHHIGYGMKGCPGCKKLGKTFHWCYYCLNGGKSYPVYCKQNHWFCSKNCPICPDCPQCQKYAKPGKRLKHDSKRHSFCDVF